MRLYSCTLGSDMLMLLELSPSFRYHASVKRISVTLDDALEEALESYLASQEAKPSITAVIQAALRQFLHDKSISADVSRGPGQTKRTISRRSVKRAGTRTKPPSR